MIAKATKVIGGRLVDRDANCIETNLLMQLFDTIPIGEIVTFEQMDAVLSIDVRRFCRSIITKVINKMKREKSRAFENVRCVGYKRLSDVDVSGASIDKERASHRRHAKRSIVTLTCVSDPNALPNENKIKHHAALSMYGAIYAMTSSSSMRKIERAVEGSKTGILPLAKTLDVFKE